jgi:hypothetical protein
MNSGCTQKKVAALLQHNIIVVKFLLGMIEVALTMLTPQDTGSHCIPSEKSICRLLDSVHVHVKKPYLDDLNMEYAVSCCALI